MSYNYREDGSRSLERFDQIYLEWYDSRRRVRRVSNRLKSNRTADLLDAIDMIELLLTKHQSYFIKDKIYQWKLTFPYLFIKPDVGDKILNRTTEEVYTIKHVEEILDIERRPIYGPIIREQKPASFTGVIILQEGHRAPRNYEDLEFVDKEKNYINFFEWGGKRNVIHPANRGDTSEKSKGPFRPTITWFVSRVEPGTIGRHPFDTAKQLKPIVREQFFDPDHTYLQDNTQVARSLQSLTDSGAITPTGFTPNITGSYYALTQAQGSPLSSTHTITVWGQWFDNLVQFDCWSISNQEANNLIYWFEDFMDLYTTILKINGVAEVLYWQRHVDNIVERWRDDIDNRTIQYYFKTEKLRVKRTRNLRQFDIRIKVSHRGEPLLTGEPTGISTITGMYGYTPSEVPYNYMTGVHFTGVGEYMWGTLDIQDIGFRET
jgi:hypothetical protein